MSTFIKSKDKYNIGGEKLRAMRLAVELTSQQLADKIGVSRPTYSGWENGRGKPNFIQFFMICDICGLNGLDILLGEIAKLKEVYLDKDQAPATSNSQSTTVTQARPKTGKKF